MEQQCYFNGRIVPSSEAKISVHDIGILRGFGVYQAVRAYGREPFKLSEHLANFRASAAAMQLTVPASDPQIEEAMRALITSNVPDGRDAVIRMILTGGEATGALEYDPSHPTFYLLCDELQPLPESILRDGARLIVHEYLRPLAHSKTTNYTEAVLLQGERKRADALEILYTWQGNVLECATSNFFLVSSEGGSASRGKNVKIITAKNNVLEGVTRSLAIELARKEFSVEERDISINEMYAADEAFLTASFKEVVPVVEVAGAKIGSGAPGPVTKRVMELFHAYAHTH